MTDKHESDHGYNCPCTPCIDIHRARHDELHKSLDELVADYVTNTDKLLSDTTVMDLIHWSYQQTINPTIKE